MRNLQIIVLGMGPSITDPRHGAGVFNKKLVEMLRGLRFLPSVKHVDISGKDKNSRGADHGILKQDYQVEDIVNELKKADVIFVSNTVNVNKYPKENELFLEVLERLNALGDECPTLINSETNYTNNGAKQRTNGHPAFIERFTKLMHGFLLHNIGGANHTLLEPYIKKHQKRVFTEIPLVIQNTLEPFSNIRRNSYGKKFENLAIYFGRPSNYKRSELFREIGNTHLKPLGFYAVMDMPSLGMGHMREFVDFEKNEDGTITKIPHPDVSLENYFGGQKNFYKQYDLSGTASDDHFLMVQDKMTLLNNDAIPQKVMYERISKALFALNTTYQPNSAGTVEYALLELALLGSIPIVCKERADEMIVVAKNGEKMSLTDYVFSNKYSGFVIWEKGNEQPALQAIQNFKYMYSQQESDFENYVDDNIELIERTGGFKRGFGYIENVIEECLAVEKKVVEKKQRGYGMIPAAGRGTRMLGLTDSPKCLLPDKNGVPIIETAVKEMLELGADSVQILVLKMNKELFEEALIEYKDKIKIHTVPDYTDSMVHSLEILQRRTSEKYNQSDKFVIGLADNAFKGNDHKEAIRVLLGAVNADRPLGMLTTITDYPEDLISEVETQIGHVFVEKPRDPSYVLTGYSAIGVFVGSGYMGKKVLGNREFNTGAGEEGIGDSWFKHLGFELMSIGNDKGYDIGTPERYADFIELKEPMEETN